MASFTIPTSKGQTHSSNHLNLPVCKKKSARVTHDLKAKMVMLAVILENCNSQLPCFSAAHRVRYNADYRIVNRFPTYTFVLYNPNVGFKTKSFRLSSFDEVQPYQAVTWRHEVAVSHRILNELTVSEPSETLGYGRFANCHR